VSCFSSSGEKAWYLFPTRRQMSASRERVQAGRVGLEWTRSGRCGPPQPISVKLKGLLDAPTSPYSFEKMWTDQLERLIDSWALEAVKT
jgi:hypothetical protein